MAYGSLFNLSEQNLIDCSSKVVDRKNINYTKELSVA